MGKENRTKRRRKKNPTWLHFDISNSQSKLRLHCTSLSFGVADWYSAVTCPRDERHVGGFWEADYKYLLNPIFGIFCDVNQIGQVFRGITPTFENVPWRGQILSIYSANPLPMCWPTPGVWSAKLCFRQGYRFVHGLTKWWRPGVALHLSLLHPSLPSPIPSLSRINSQPLQVSFLFGDYVFFDFHKKKIQTFWNLNYIQDPSASHELDIRVEKFWALPIY